MVSYATDKHVGYCVLKEDCVFIEMMEETNFEHINPSFLHA